MNQIKAGLLVAMLFSAGAINAAVVIDDTFGDGDFGTNTDGTGTGFVQFENTQPGDGTITESGGQAQINTTTNASYQITGMASKDGLGVSELDTLTVVWDISSVDTTNSVNSVQFSVQGGTGYNQPAFLMLQMNANNTLYVKGKKIDGGEFNISNFDFTQSDLFDGFTVTLTASASGWTYDFTGLGSVTSISGGYGSGNSFTDLIGSTSRVGAGLQRTSSSGVTTLNVDQITADVGVVIVSNEKVIIGDRFGDDNYQTNSDGIGSGFTRESNNVGSGKGYATESGGQVLLKAYAANNNMAGFISKDDLNVGSSDTLTVVWDIDSASGLRANGIELLVQGGTGLRTDPNLFLQMQPGGVLAVKVDEVGGAGEQQVYTGAFTLADVLDGFTATLTANTSGWQYDFTGLGTVTSISGTYGTLGFTDVVKTDSRVAVAVQGNADPVGSLTINQITATNGLTLIVDDTFDDSNYTTNTTGTGTGFSLASNNVGSGGIAAGAVTESGDQVQITTYPYDNNMTGIVSKDDLKFGGTNDSVVVVWDIGSASGLSANGIELLVQSGAGFRSDPTFLLHLDASTNILVKVDDGSGEQTIHTSSYVNSNILDGFTVILTASTSGWQVDFTGLGDVTSISGVGYGTSTFFDLFVHSSRVGAAVQGNAVPVGTLTINEIRVNATTLVLWKSDYGITDVLADTDGDGLDNLSEFGLGGDPTNHMDQGYAPANWQSGSSLDYVYPMRSGIYNGVSYYLETTENLVVGPWAGSGFTELGTTADGYAAGFDAVTNQMDTSVKGEQFVRLRIEER